MLTPASFSQYTAAVKTSSLEPTAKTLTSLDSLLKKDPKLATILAAPTLSPSDKSAIVAELEKAAGVQGETVKNFLQTLAENNRLSILPGVCEKFGELISAAHGEVEMTVTSATVCRDFLLLMHGERFRREMMMLTRMNYSNWSLSCCPASRLPSPSHPTSARARN